MYASSRRIFPHLNQLGFYVGEPSRLLIWSKTEVAVDRTGNTAESSGCCQLLLMGWVDLPAEEHDHGEEPEDEDGKDEDALLGADQGT